MGTYHYAKLLYGYDLGSAEDPRIEEVEGYGNIQTDWFERDDEGFTDESIRDAVIRRLYESLPGPDPEGTQVTDSHRETVVKERLGVWVEDHGWGYEDQPSYALAAHVFDVDGGDSLLIDPVEMLALQSQLDERLNHALELLAGFTPTDNRGWQLVADR